MMQCTCTIYSNYYNYSYSMMQYMYMYTQNYTCTVHNYMYMYITCTYCKIIITNRHYTSVIIQLLKYIIIIHMVHTCTCTCVHGHSGLL